MIDRGDFLEYNCYNGNYYGTSKEYVMDKVDNGINVILEIDVNGAKNVKKIYSDALLIYIAPPSMEELEKRIRGRRTEAEDVIKERLDKARREIATKDQYKHVVVNDDVMRAKDDIVKIIEEIVSDNDIFAGKELKLVTSKSEFSVFSIV